MASGRRWAALGAITVVSFVLLLEDTAVSVVLPDIRADLGLGLTGLEWLVNAYTLALAVLVLPAGKLADAYGRRRMFVAGLVVFTGASVLAGLAGNGDTLVAARAVQGAGAALTASAALSVISSTFAGHERGAALGVWAGASAVGLAVGPVLGAMLADMFGWSWVFLITVPLTAVAAVTAGTLIPESSSPTADRGLPWRAVMLWAGALVALITALTEASSSGWLSARVLTLTALAAAFVIAFAIVERRGRQRLIAPALLHSRTTMGANALSLLSTAVMCNLFFFVALYLQLILGYSTISAGAALLPLTITIVLTAPIAGRVSDRIGRRTPIIVGLLVLAAGLLLLSTAGTESRLGLIAAGLALSGLGIGATTSPITAAALDNDSADVAGESAGLLNTARMIGLSLGIATMGAVIAGGGDVLARDPGARAAFVSGLAVALRINAAIAAFAALVALVTLRPSAVRASGADTLPAASHP